jgi:hypothetical protein
MPFEMMVDPTVLSPVATSVQVVGYTRDDSFWLTLFQGCPKTPS